MALQTAAKAKHGASYEPTMEELQLKAARLQARWHKKHLTLARDADNIGIDRQEATTALKQLRSTAAYQGMARVADAASFDAQLPHASSQAQHPCDLDALDSSGMGGTITNGGQATADKPKKGDPVRIHSLASRPELNGKQGVVERFSKSTGRFDARVSGNLLRQHNLEVFSPQPEPST